MNKLKAHEAFKQFQNHFDSINNKVIIEGLEFKASEILVSLNEDYYFRIMEEWQKENNIEVIYE